MSDASIQAAGVPPPGVMPNFIDPPSLTPAYKGTIFSFVPLMILFLLARLYVRLCMIREFGPDDYLCILGASSILAYSGVLIPLFDKPLGRHMWDVPITDINERYLLLVSLVLILSLVAALFIKLTLLVLYLRLFKVYRLARWLIWAGVAIVTAFYLISIILIVDKCAPRGGQSWFEASSTWTCTPVQNWMLKGGGIFGLVSDLYILAIPVWLVSRLTFPIKRKVGILAIFLTGSLACGFSVAALVARYQWRAEDGTYSMLYVFGVLELTIGNICACMPVLTPLLRRTAEACSSLWQRFHPRFLTLKRNHPRNNENGLQNFERIGEDQMKLPNVPRGVMASLHTFIRKSHRTDPADTELQARGNDTILSTQHSVEYSYHDQLRSMFSHVEDTKAGSELWNSEVRTLPTSSSSGLHNKQASSK